MAVEEETVPCETCGTPTPHLNTKRCNGCWGIERRLRSYLTRGGDRARAFVLAALAETAGSVTTVSEHDGRGIS